MNDPYTESTRLSQMARLLLVKVKKLVSTGWLPNKIMNIEPLKRFFFCLFVLPTECAVSFSKRFSFLPTERAVSLSKKDCVWTIESAVCISKTDNSRSIDSETYLLLCPVNGLFWNAVHGTFISWNMWELLPDVPVNNKDIIRTIRCKLTWLNRIHEVLPRYLLMQRQAFAKLDIFVVNWQIELHLVGWWCHVSGYSLETHLPGNWAKLC